MKVETLVTNYWKCWIGTKDVPGWGPSNGPLFSGEANIGIEAYQEHNNLFFNNSNEPVHYLGCVII